MAPHTLRIREDINSMSYSAFCELAPPISPILFISLAIHAMPILSLGSLHLLFFAGLVHSDTLSVHNTLLFLWLSINYTVLIIPSLAYISP